MILISTAINIIEQLYIQSFEHGNWNSILQDYNRSYWLRLIGENSKELIAMYQ